MSIFGKAFKAVKKVAGKVLVRTIARTVVGSVPILGGVVSAVGAVKSALHPPTVASTANLSARTGAPAFGHPGLMHGTRTRRTPPGTRRKRAPAYGPPGEYHPRQKRAKRGAGGGTAKQRAARARFAKAAKRGRIKKGSHL